MSDLISRQAAIEILAFGEKYFRHLVDDIHVDGYEREKCEWGIYLIETYIAGMKDLPSVQPEQRWTPVSERPPKKNGRYLVTRGLNAAGNIWNRVYIVNYSDLMGLKKEKIFWIGNVGKNDFEQLQDVTAWQPLPEPYKEKEE